jgi:UDP-GlcNAc:undecaprenyl-phosphate/decaprenyl-phosphate GlcNAc-1-phosphate transferase
MHSLKLYSLFLGFTSGAVLALLFTKYVCDFATRKGLVAPPELGRHVHTKALPRLGGVALYLSIMLVLLCALIAWHWTGLARPFSFTRWLGLLGPASIAFLLGLYDDLRGANAYLKFGVQTIAAALLYFGGYGVQQFDLFSRSHALGTLVGLPVTIFWVLLITNAFNLIDGLDGLAAGSAFFSTLVLFVVFLLQGSLNLAFMTLALAGAILGFLPYNFNPAVIFLGDSGSLFIGFLLSALALAGSQKATTIVAVTIPIIAFGLPIVDVSLAVARRLLRGSRLFTGDDDHIHHKLLKRGLSQREAVLTLYAITAAFGLLSLAVLHGEKMIAAALIIIAIGVLWGIQQLHYVEFSELGELLRQAGIHRRILANNVSVRRASESLAKCTDLGKLCEILQETFQPLGFDGFRIENFSCAALPLSRIRPLHRHSNGSLHYVWSGHQESEPAWELRLQLSGCGAQTLAYLCLFQMEENRPLLFDLRVVTNGVRASISDAIGRSVPDVNPDATASRSHALASD